MRTKWGKMAAAARTRVWGIWRNMDVLRQGLGFGAYGETWMCSGVNEFNALKVKHAASENPDIPISAPWLKNKVADR
jgi:hypothetical protein